MEKDITKNLGFYIQRISRVLTHQHNVLLEEKGITISQFKVLLSLWEEDGKTQNEILEDVLVKPSTLTGLLNILEKKKLVKRTVDIHDARIRRITLTDEGKKLEKVSLETVDQMEKKLSKSLSADEKKFVIELLGRVKKTLENENE